MAEQFCLEYVPIPEVRNRCDRMPPVEYLSHQ